MRVALCAVIVFASMIARKTHGVDRGAILPRAHFALEAYPLAYIQCRGSLLGFRVAAAAAATATTSAA